mmetsp:Transcript_39945/g.93767  ORF Transcript_39945/g.93767 Transcript_39945/m.93767 type:complete len:305 (+) Transcript_39945:197-1111(+)
MRPVSLQLVQHEESPPGPSKRVEVGQDVGGRPRGHRPVEPETHGHDVDAGERRRAGEGGDPGQVRAGGYHRADSSAAEGEDDAVHVFQDAFGAVPSVRQGVFAVGAEGYGGDLGAPQNLQSVFALQFGRQRRDEGGGNGSSFDPSHVEAVVVRSREEIDEFQHHQRRQLLQRFEETHQEKRPDELIYQPRRESAADAEIMAGHAIVSQRDLLVLVVQTVQGSQKEPRDRRAVRPGQPPEERRGGEDLAQRGGQGGEREVRYLRPREDGAVTSIPSGEKSDEVVQSVSASVSSSSSSSRSRTRFG